MEKGVGRGENKKETKEDRNEQRDIAKISERYVLGPVAKRHFSLPLTHKRTSIHTPTWIMK